MNVSGAMVEALAMGQEDENPIVPSEYATKVFRDLLASVAESSMPFPPQVSVGDGGGWRADWFVWEPAISVRLIVAAARDSDPVIYREGSGAGCELIPANPSLLTKELLWMKATLAIAEKVES